VAGDGYFFDLGSHQLDLLDYLLGPIAAAAGSAANQAGLYPASDAVCATFRFKSGVMGTGSWCFTAFDSGRTDRTEIIGSEGSISYSAFDLDAPVVLEKDGGNVEEFTFSPPQHVQQPLIQAVVDDLLGRGSCPSTGQSAARTSRVLDQIVSAATSGLETE
jgi:predicted dehydrogenase